MFDGTLGTWKTDPEYIKLKENVKLIYSIPYPVPKVHKKKLKEVGRLVILGVLNRSNDLEWGDPYFAQTKSKKISF